MNWPAIALLLVGLAGLTGFGAGLKYQKGVYAETELERKQGWSDALDATAKELAKLKVEHRTINRATEKIIEREQVYKECKNTPEVLGVLNDAAKGGK